jgi:MFS family permease
VLLGVSVIALLLTLDRLSGTRFDGLVLALPVVAATNLLYFVIPYFLQDVGQHGPAVTGAVLLALPAGMAAASLLANVLAGTVADRLGPRRMALGGATPRW